MRFADFTGVFSDLLLASFACWLAYALSESARRLREHAVAYWFGAFCAVAASSFLAALWHSLANTIDPQFTALLWTTSLALAVAASFLFLVATLYVFASARLLGLLCGCAALKFALFAVWATLDENVGLIFYDIGLTMLVMLSCASWGAWRNRVPAASWMILGVVTAMVAALFLQGRVSMHRYFNHNDLFHVTQMGALYFLYQAGALLRDKDPGVPDFEATQPLRIIGEE